MEDLSEIESSVRITRPSLAQVKAIVNFMQKHPELENLKRFRYGVNHEKFKKLWSQLSTLANSLEGSVKSPKGWIKFWSDKRRVIKRKQKQIDEGKINDRLTPLEKKILDLSVAEDLISTKKKKGVKQEPLNGEDEDSNDDSFLKEIDEMDFSGETTKLESDERQMSIMEKLVEVMDQQAVAMNQLAQASLSNSKAMERLAEASHIQALAVDRLANSFDSISSSVHEVRNAIMSIDYSMKRCYSATAQHRQNPNIFS
ncbi:uncharacterized protein LOC125225584 [Leguminivora glycinivorella]|uniref:uncharacterized protein LOC125225584 n=1 Tax=Leguminivora glycinivorella TaxID=1035111 RepID=UPI00200F5D50|nr:uncharacterized protein LOC125225584 [Leguminivora glycinivorella]